MTHPGHPIMSATHPEAERIAKEHGIAAVRMMLVAGMPGGTRTQRVKARAFAQGYSQAAADIFASLRAQAEQEPRDD